MLVEMRLAYCKGDAGYKIKSVNDIVRAVHTTTDTVYRIREIPFFNCKNQLSRVKSFQRHSSHRQYVGQKLVKPHISSASVESTTLHLRQPLFEELRLPSGSPL